MEYHQLTTQDPSSPSYEQTIRGICLDFSSPESKLDSNVADEKNDYEESESISAPFTDNKLEEATSSWRWGALQRTMCLRGACLDNMSSAISVE